MNFIELVFSSNITDLALTYKIIIGCILYFAVAIILLIVFLRFFSFEIKK